MFRVSNNLILLLNFVTLILSIPIIMEATSLKKNNDCEVWMETPLLVFGISLAVLSGIGLIGVCCSATTCTWIYLFLMYMLILALFFFNIFIFVITNKNVGEAVSGIGFEEYRLGDYSNWLQKRVEDPGNWKKIRSCLHEAKICSNLDSSPKDDIQRFYKEHLSNTQGGCCKPPGKCNFQAKSATEWTKPEKVNSEDKDCNAWDNDPTSLCFDCNACKAGVLETVRKSWVKISILNFIIAIALCIIYSIGCCAYRNDRAAEFRRYNNYRY